MGASFRSESFGSGPRSAGGTGAEGSLDAELAETILAEFGMEDAYAHRQHCGVRPAKALAPGARVTRLLELKLEVYEMTQQATTTHVPNSEETKLLIKFPPVRHAGTVYDLSHLDPSVVEYIQAGTETVAAKVYKVNVIYTQHCFTRDIPRSGAYDKTLEHMDGKEIRLFDVDRWELSKRLPEIVHALAERTCQHAKENNFVTIEAVTGGGEVVEYDVFFVASKAMRPGFINLVIQSAYLKEQKQTGKRVSFLKILFSALNGKRLRS